MTNSNLHLLVLGRVTSALPIPNFHSLFRIRALRIISEAIIPLNSRDILQLHTLQYYLCRRFFRFSVYWTTRCLRFKLLMQFHLICLIIVQHCIRTFSHLDSGTGDGIWTRMILLSQNFKSCAYSNSATPAYGWDNRIRTNTLTVKVSCATFTLYPNKLRAAWAFATTRALRLKSKLRLSTPNSVLSPNLENEQLFQSICLYSSLWSGRDQPRCIK